MKSPVRRPEIPPRLFRKVMSAFATGVTVVTADDGNGPRGMTANAFMSGSLDPPLCVISVARRAHMHAALARGGRFGVNMLAHDQETEAMHFAGRPVPGFRATFAQIAGAPVLAEAMARIAAEVVAGHDCGDHTLFIGHILHMEAGDRVPLVYHDGRFGSLAYRRGDQEVTVPEFW